MIIHMAPGATGEQSQRVIDRITRDYGLRCETIEGDTTVYFISKQLQNPSIQISTIARGVSFGGELEYADELTLGRSIISRVPYHTQKY